jgi:hypothetical protein
MAIRHHQIAKPRYIFIVQVLDKKTWKDANNEFHTDEREAYIKLEAIRKMTLQDVRFRLRKFAEAE